MKILWEITKFLLFGIWMFIFGCLLHVFLTDSEEQND